MYESGGCTLCGSRCATCWHCKIQCCGFFLFLFFVWGVHTWLSDENFLKVFVFLCGVFDNDGVNSHRISVSHSRIQPVFGCSTWVWSCFGFETFSKSTVPHVSHIQKPSNTKHAFQWRYYEHQCTLWYKFTYFLYPWCPQRCSEIPFI